MMQTPLLKNAMLGTWGVACLIVSSASTMVCRAAADADAVQQIRLGVREAIVALLDAGVEFDAKVSVFRRLVTVKIIGADDDGVEAELDGELTTIEWADITDGSLAAMLESAGAQSDAGLSPEDTVRAGILYRLGGDDAVGRRMIRRAFAAAPDRADELTTMVVAVFGEVKKIEFNFSSVEDSRPLTPDSAVAGEHAVGLPTARCIGISWIINGDQNANATVELYYREKGTEPWRRAMNLFRTQRKFIRESDRPPEGATLFAGSIFYLKPDTEYEVRMLLKDPDGRNAETIDTVRTWTEPFPPKPKRVIYVMPGTGGGGGTSGSPYKGLAAATAHMRPGDRILLRGGVYKERLAIETSGTTDAPIVFAAAPGETPILDGGGANEVIRFDNCKYIFVEGLSLRNAEIGLISRGSSYMTFRRLTITDVVGAIDAQFDGSNRRIWISDCTIIGNQSWPRPDNAKFKSNRAIMICGEGSVVCYNRVAKFKDGIDTMENPPNRDIDFYNNDISECGDDGIELDVSDRNTRAFDNRLTNCFQGISFQPIYGGPAYAIRNAIYNVPVEPFKLHSLGLGENAVELSGAVILHNTIVKHTGPIHVHTPATFHNTIVMNNFFVGGPGSAALDISAPVDACVFDYNVYAGGPYRAFKVFATDAVGNTAEKNGLYRPGHDRLFASDLKVPEKSEIQFDVSVNDMRLAPGSPAIDRGAVLYNINDDYTGNAPDAGCIEFGDALPHYGPRAVKE